MYFYLSINLKILLSNFKIMLSKVSLYLRYFILIFFSEKIIHRIKSKVDKNMVKLNFIFKI